MQSVQVAQRESNDLLQRKSTWTDADVSRFTELVRRDHLTENDEREARRVLQEREEEVEKGFSGARVRLGLFSAQYVIITVQLSCAPSLPAITKSKSGLTRCPSH